MEARATFHGIYSWKLQSIEAMEASTVHIFPWKLAITSMEVNTLPPTSMEISMEVNLLPPTAMEASMEVNGLPPTAMEASMEVNGLPCKLVEAFMEVVRTEVGGPLGKSCGSSWKFVTGGKRWKYVRVYRSSWKLPRNTFMEAAVDGSNRSFHFHRQWKLPCTSMEVVSFHGRKSTPTIFHGNFHGSKLTSMK